MTTAWCEIIIKFYKYQSKNYASFPHVQGKITKIPNRIVLQYVMLKHQHHLCLRLSRRLPWCDIDVQGNVITCRPTDRKMQVETLNNEVNELLEEVDQVIEEFHAREQLLSNDSTLDKHDNVFLEERNGFVYEWTVTKREDEKDTDSSNRIYQNKAQVPIHEPQCSVNTKPPEKKKKSWLERNLPVVVGIGAAVVAPVAIPLVVGAVGFGSGGIVAGSIATKMMSVAAVANGGGVAAGGVIATLQSIGATGAISTSLAAATGTAAGVATKVGQVITDEDEE